MRKFYSLDEIHGASIIDSEGLYYGSLCGVEYTAGKVELKACIKHRANDIIPDREKLYSLLVNKGINVPPTATLEYLVRRARLEGLEIPRKTVEKEIVLVKGFVKLNEIVLIDVKYLEEVGETKRIAVILLNEPREAMYRGIPLQKALPEPKPEFIAGKIVISYSRGILGKAVELVVGPGEPGIRVSLKIGSKGYISWLAYLTELKRLGLYEVYEYLADIYDPYQHSRIDATKYDEIVGLLKRTSAPKEALDLLDKFVVAEKSIVEYTDIPWSSIRKIRDYILVE